MKRSIFVIAASTALTLAPNLSAAACTSLTDCTYAITLGNQSGFGGAVANYGTVELTLVNGTIKFDVELAQGYTLINTGSGGKSAVGWNKLPNTAGPSGTSNDNFTYTSGVSVASGTTGYSGYTDDTIDGATPAGNGTNETHMDGFGYFRDTFGTTAPANGAGLSSVVFTVSRTGSGSPTFADIQDLVNLADPAGNDGAAYFAFDVCKSDGKGGCAATGLVAVTDLTNVPEPGLYGALALGMSGLFFVVSRRRSKSQA